MTEGKRELLHLIELDRRIDDRAAELQRIRARLESMHAGGLGERVSGTKASGLADGVAALVDLERQMDQAIDAWIQERVRIVTKVMAVEPEEYRRLLYYRYVLGMKLYEVATRMKYSYSWARQMHSRALYIYNKLYF